MSAPGISCGGSKIVLVQYRLGAVEATIYPELRTLVRSIIEARSTGPHSEHIAWLKTLPALIEEAINDLEADWHEIHYEGGEDGEE